MSSAASCRPSTKPAQATSATYSHAEAHFSFSSEIIVSVTSRQSSFESREHKLIGPSPYLKIGRVLLDACRDLENYLPAPPDELAAHLYQHPPDALDGLRPPRCGHGEHLLGKEQIIRH